VIVDLDSGARPFAQIETLGGQRTQSRLIHRRELSGYVAAEANHVKIKNLEKELRQLYGRIADVLESYTDEPDESPP
jgi:hypothetical protein